MDFESVFKKENIDLIFNDLDSEYSYIAETGDLFSVFMDRNDFGYKWAWKFPAGRYVITIFQRHSLFRNGVFHFLIQQHCISGLSVS